MAQEETFNSYIVEQLHEKQLTIEGFLERYEIIDLYFSFRNFLARKNKLQGKKGKKIREALELEGIEYMNFEGHEIRSA